MVSMTQPITNFPKMGIYFPGPVQMLCLSVTEDKLSTTRCWQDKYSTVT